MRRAVCQRQLSFLYKLHIAAISAMQILPQYAMYINVSEASRYFAVKVVLYSRKHVNTASVIATILC